MAASGGDSLCQLQRAVWLCLAVPKLSVQPRGHLSCVAATGHMESHLTGHFPGGTGHCSTAGQCRQQEQGLGCSRVRMGHETVARLAAPGSVPAGLPPSNFLVHCISLCSQRFTQTIWFVAQPALLALPSHHPVMPHTLGRLVRAAWHSWAQHLDLCLLLNACLPSSMGRTAPVLGPAWHCPCPHRQH